MIDITKLKLLRDQTGVSFSLCKKALEESNNNLENAKKKLVELAGDKISEKQKRPTAAGAIFTYVHHNKKIAAFIEIMCETDFVSSNQEFLKLGNELAMQLASMPAKNKEELLTQEYIRDSSIKIGDFVKATIGKLGENITVSRFTRYQLSDGK